MYLGAFATEYDAVLAVDTVDLFLFESGAGLPWRDGGLAARLQLEPQPQLSEAKLRELERGTPLTRSREGFDELVRRTNAWADSTRGV